MTDYFEASLTYQEPPNGIFSPQFPVIGGSGCNGQLHSGDKEKLYLELKFLRKVENVESVTLSLIGKRTNQYYRIISDDNITFSTLLDVLRKFELPKLRVQIFSKKAELFRHTQNLFNYKNDDTSILSGGNIAYKNHFEKDEILKLKFDEFRFPYDRRQLPSTFSYFNFSWRLRTKYYLKVEVIRSGTLIKCKYVPYELKYQAGFHNKFKTNITNLIHKDLLIASHKHVFRRRPKKYYMNNCEQVLENELNYSHGNTRIIRSLFFEKYKKEIYKNLTKDIDLNIKFIPNSYDSKFPNYFDIGNNFLNQLGKFRIETESVPNAGLSPDFIIDQVSTELGKFHIKSIGIYIQDKFNITVDEFNSGNIKTKLKIFEKKFPRKILDENGVVCEEEDEDEDLENDTEDDDDDEYDGDNDKDDFKEKADLKEDKKSKIFSSKGDFYVTTKSIFSKRTGGGGVVYYEDYDDVEATFDICKFEQDPKKPNIYFTIIDLQDLLCDEDKKFPQPLLGTYEIENCFCNDIKVEIKLVLESRYKRDIDKKTFNLGFGILLGNNDNFKTETEEIRKNYEIRVEGVNKDKSDKTEKSKRSEVSLSQLGLDFASSVLHGESADTSLSVDNAIKDEYYDSSASSSIAFHNKAGSFSGSDFQISDSGSDLKSDSAANSKSLVKSGYNYDDAGADADADDITKVESKFENISISASVKSIPIGSNTNSSREDTRAGSTSSEKSVLENSSLFSSSLLDSFGTNQYTYMPQRGSHSRVPSITISHDTGDNGISQPRKPQIIDPKDMYPPQKEIDTEVVINIPQVSLDF